MITWEFKGKSLAVGEELKSSPDKGQYITSDNGLYCLCLRDDGNLLVLTGTDPDNSKHVIFQHEYNQQGNYFARMQANGIFAIYKTDDIGIITRCWISEEKSHQISNTYVAKITDDGNFGIATDALQKENNRWNNKLNDPAIKIEMSNVFIDKNTITLVDSISRLPISTPEEKIIVTGNETTCPYPDKPYKFSITQTGTDTNTSYWGEIPYNLKSVEIVDSDVKPPSFVQIPRIMHFDFKTKKPDVEFVDSDLNYIFMGWTRTKPVEDKFEISQDCCVPPGKTYKFQSAVWHAVFRLKYTYKARITFKSNAIIDGLQTFSDYFGENGWEGHPVKPPLDVTSKKAIENIPLSR